MFESFFNSHTMIKKDDRSYYENLRKSLFESGNYDPKPCTVNIPDKDSGSVRFSNLSEDGYWIFDLAPKFEKHLLAMSQENEDYSIGPWRLQLLKSPDLSLSHGSHEGPTYGVRYDLYYGKENTGELELMPGFYSSRWDDDKENPNAREIWITVTIDNASILPYEHLQGLLSVATNYITRYQDETERLSNRIAIQHALQQVMWEAIRKNDILIPMDFSADGVIPKDRVS